MVLASQSNHLHRQTQHHGLGGLRTAELKIVFSRWVDDLVSPDESARKKADQLLRTSGDRALEVMIDSLNTCSAQHQWKLLPILGEIGTEAALRAVATCLNSENSAIVAAAAQVLGRSENPIAAELVLMHMQTASAHSEASLIWMTATLGQLKERRAVQFLVDTLHSTQNATLRYTAIEALGKIGDRRVLPEICRYMDDPSHHVRDKVQVAIEMLAPR